MKRMNSGDLAKAFKALSDGSRIEILRLLSENSLCVKALVARLHISQPAVSQHLRILREAGLISGKKKGYWVHYRVNEGALAKLKNAMEQFFCMETGRDACPPRSAGKERRKPCVRKKRVVRSRRT